MYGDEINDKNSVCDAFLIPDITFQQTYWGEYQLIESQLPFPLAATCLLFSISSNPNLLQAGHPYKKIQNYFFVSEPLAWIPNSQPINPKYVRQLSYWQRRLVKDGTYQTGEDRWNPKVPQKADPHHIFTDENLGLQGMTAFHFSGPSLFCLVSNEKLSSSHIVPLLPPLTSVYFPPDVRCHSPDPRPRAADWRGLRYRFAAQPHGADRRSGAV